MGIFGYSGLTRRDVRVYVVKSFEDEFDRRRLYALEPIPADGRDDRIIGFGTYTGPAVRHMTHLLSGLEEEIRILFLLTESGHQAIGYDGSYARTDVRKAFLEARKKGIMPFAISFGENGKEMLEESYGKDFVTVSNPLQLARKMP